MAESTSLTVYPVPTARAAFVVAHGAGAGQQSPFMVRLARGLAERGIQTATFDFPYMAARRKAPDKAPVLEASWREAIEQARRAFGGARLFIGGKSMGGRIASQVAAQGVEGLAGLVFLGYPLHPPGRPDQRRDAHLPRIQEPMLFVQGTRDTFGTADDIAALLPSLRHAEVRAVADGDHSFKVPAKSGGAAVLDAIMDDVARWMLARA